MRHIFFHSYSTESGTNTSTSTRRTQNYSARKGGRSIVSSRSGAQGTAETESFDIPDDQQITYPGYQAADAKASTEEKRGGMRSNKKNEDAYRDKKTVAMNEVLDTCKTIRGTAMRQTLPESLEFAAKCLK